MILGDGVKFGTRKGGDRARRAAAGDLANKLTRFVSMYSSKQSFSQMVNPKSGPGRRPSDGESPKVVISSFSSLEEVASPNSKDWSTSFVTWRPPDDVALWISTLSKNSRQLEPLRKSETWRS